MKVIAEVGSNVKTIEDCIHSIEHAKIAGADAVKFQCFTSEEMYGISGQGETFIQLADLQYLKTVSERCEIEFMCTMFSPYSLQRALPLLNTIKIASSDMEYLDLIDVAMASGKDIYLSTGGHTAKEIARIVDYIGFNNPKLTLFYCESEYPTYRTDLRKLSLEPFLAFEKVGLSDHSKEVYSTISEANDYGICAVEKHVNFCGYKDTPDAPHSLSFEDFKLYCAAARGNRPKDFLSPGEQPMRLRHNRRLVVTAPIAKGDIFQYHGHFEYPKNFGVYRSLVDNLDGMNPIFYDKVNQTVADRDYNVGDII